MSKADRLRRLKRKREVREHRGKTTRAEASPGIATPPRKSGVVDSVIRPTPERMGRGRWTIPSGPGQHDAPAFDAEHDMIGALYAAGKITSAQHDAARLFQEIVAAFLAELGVSGYRSCLNVSAGGYDASDGDPDAMRRHQDLRDRLGVVRYLYLRSEIAKPAGARTDLRVLRTALDGMCG